MCERDKKGHHGASDPFPGFLGFFSCRFRFVPIFFPPYKIENGKNSSRTAVVVIFPFLQTDLCVILLFFLVGFPLLFFLYLLSCLVREDNFESEEGVSFFLLFLHIQRENSFSEYPKLIPEFDSLRFVT